MSEPTAAESPENETQPRQKTREIILRTAAAVAAVALLFVLDGPANQHEWAVGWLRRYEQFSPFTLLALISLERFAAALVLFLPFVLIDKLRKAPKEPELPEKSLFSRFIANPVLNTLYHAAPVLILKLAGAGIGTQALASACVFTAAKCKKPRFVVMIAPALYMGFAFAHWASSSWALALGMTALAAAAIQKETVFLVVVPVITAAATAVITPIEAVKRWKSFMVFALIAALAIWSGAGGWAVEWFQDRYKIHSPWSHCWRITLEGTVVSIPFWYLAAFAHVFIGKRLKPKKKPKAEKKDDAESKPKKKPKAEKKDSEDSKPEKKESDEKKEIKFTYFKEILAPLVVAPIGETLFYQTVPIALLHAAGFSVGTQFIVSAALFAWAHYVDSFGKGIASGIPGGIYLGYPFVRWFPNFWTAFWVTTVSHFLHNLFATIAEGMSIFGKIEHAVRQFAERLKKRMQGGKKSESREE